MDASSENAKKKKKIAALLRQICFRKKRIKESPFPGYCKRQGDDTYALAIVYDRENWFSRAEKVGLASVRYYRQALLQEETVNALWDLSWSWILLRDLYRWQPGGAYRDKALHAAMQCVRLFLRMTRLSNGVVYFKNYQVSCVIAVKIMLAKGGACILQADDLCKACIRELQRWPNLQSDPVACCRMGRMWFLRLSVYEAMQKNGALDDAEGKKKQRRAIKQGTLLYQKAMDLGPQNADVAVYVVDDYHDQQQNEALSAKLRCYYAQKEYACYELLFLHNPKKYARSFFLSAMLYCQLSADRFSGEEKQAIFANMERHMKYVDFCAAHDQDVPYYRLKAVYYLAEVHRACFPADCVKRCLIQARCCLLGVPLLAPGHYDHDTCTYFLLALEDLLNEDAMPARFRAAFAERVQKVLDVIMQEDVSYNSEAKRFRAKLNTYKNGGEDLSFMSYYDFDGEDE